MNLDLHLLLHALIILLIGLISGAPMGKAINRGASEDTIRAWRVAHSGLSMGGIMLMTMAVVIGHLQPSSLLRLGIIAPAIISGYGFAIGLPLGAMTGNRGLSSKAPSLNRLVYLGNLLGAYGSLIAVLVMLITVIKTMLS